MKSIGDERGVESMCKRVLAAAVAGLSFGAMMMAPAIVAAKSGDETRVVSYRAVDRAEIENLQRWVAAGHEDWCKDARLVAAEEFRRLAPDFAAHAAELKAVESGESAHSAKKVAFDWTPLDGRATYRVALERFEWLLPIARDAEAVVWVPTATEIQVHE